MLFFYRYYCYYYIIKKNMYLDIFILNYNNVIVVCVCSLRFLHYHINLRAIFFFFCYLTSASLCVQPVCVRPQFLWGGRPVAFLGIWTKGSDVHNEREQRTTVRAPEFIILPFSHMKIKIFIHTYYRHKWINNYALSYCCERLTTGIKFS